MLFDPFEKIFQKSSKLIDWSLCWLLKTTDTNTLIAFAGRV